MFRDFFEVIPANTQELLDEVYRLRYQVYCVETGFERKEDFPDEREQDSYDQRSVHCLLRHRRSGLYAGTVRLVQPESNNLCSLPLHDVLDHAFFRDRTRFHPAKTVEVSRFAISKSFRRRLGEYYSPTAAGASDPERERQYKVQEQRVLPHITLGLFIAMVRMSRELGVTTWFCVMEKALVRLLARYSLYFQPVGPTIEYHGQRQPCFADIGEFLERARAEQPEIWTLITEDGTLWPAEQVASNRINLAGQ